jgi:hypothetical protein
MREGPIFDALAELGRNGHADIASAARAQLELHGIQRYSEGYEHGCELHARGVPRTLIDAVNRIEKRLYHLAKQQEESAKINQAKLEGIEESISWLMKRLQFQQAKKAKARKKVARRAAGRQKS